MLKGLVCVFPLVFYSCPWGCRAQLIALPCLWPAERDKSCPSPKQSPAGGPGGAGAAAREPCTSREAHEPRQVHSEGETLSDDDTPPAAMAARLRKISFRKLKVWR